MEEVTIDPQEVAAHRVEGVLRLAVPLVFTVLVALIATGVLDAEALSAAVASVLAIAGLVLAWWKDNNMTLGAILRHIEDYVEEEEEE